MKTMKKRTVGVFAVAVGLALAGVSCGGEDDSKYEISVTDYCDMYKKQCGYITEILSTCIDDYSKRKCNSEYLTFMNCALSNTTAGCCDTELCGSDDAIAQAKKICDDSWKEYKDCAY